MGFSVHNGYRLARDPFDILAHGPALTRCRDTLADIAVAKLVTEAVDGVTDTDGRSPLAYAQSVLGSANGESMIRSPLYDLGVSFTFFKDRGSGTYALLFCEQDDYRHLFEAIEGVEPWPYWDEDQLEICSEDWEHRREVWQRLLGCGTPASNGLTWTPFLAGWVHTREISWEQVALHLPPKRLRAEAVAAAQACDRLARSTFRAQIAADYTFIASRTFQAAVRQLARDLYGGVLTGLVDIDESLVR